MVKKGLFAIKIIRSESSSKEIYATLKMQATTSATPKVGLPLHLISKVGANQVKLVRMSKSMHQGQAVLRDNSFE